MMVNCISKKHFRPGGMAPSEWTRSVRAVRDTPVADYSAPGVNTMRRVAHRPPIAVSPFLPQTLQEHSQMLNRERCIWQLWEVTSRLFARALYQIHHRSLVASRCLFPDLSNFACTFL